MFACELLSKDQVILSSGKHFIATTAKPEMSRFWLLIIVNLKSRVFYSDQNEIEQTLLDLSLKFKRKTLVMLVRVLIKSSLKASEY